MEMPETRYARSGDVSIAYPASHAAPARMLVSDTVKDLVAGSGIEFRERGVALLEGVPGKWRLFAVESAAA